MEYYYIKHMTHYSNYDYDNSILTELSESNIYQASSSKEFIKHMLSHPENEYYFDVKCLVYDYLCINGKWKIIDNTIIYENHKISIDALVQKIQSKSWIYSDIDGFFIEKIDMIVVDPCSKVYKVNKVDSFFETYDQERCYEIEKTRLYQAKSKKNIIRYILKHDGQEDDIIDQRELLRKECKTFDSWKIVQSLDHSLIDSSQDIIQFELNNTFVHEIPLEDFLDKIDRNTYKFDYNEVTCCYIKKKKLIVV